MTKTIMRCPECGHAEYEHAEERYKGRACSGAWCPCSKVLADVMADGQVEEIPTFPGFDHATGKWARR